MSLSVATLSTAITGFPSGVSAGLEHFAHVAAPMAMTALWQGLAIAVALTVALRLAPRVSAAQRFAAWAIGFAVVATLPLVPLFGRIGSATDPVTAAGTAASRPWLELAPGWSVAIALLWAFASLLRAVDLGVHVVRLRRIWKTAVPVDLPVEVGGPAVAPRRARRVQICSTTELDRPSVIGFLAPRILVPRWLLERLTAGELEQVVLHEAEHLRRRDDWTNLLQKVCLVLFPLNPALWWMEQRLCREREMACDEGVVRQTRAPRAYAACLASLAERGLARRAEALTLGAWQRRPELVDRVHRILARGPRMSPLATGGFLAVVVCGLIGGSAELARCPQLVAFDAVPHTLHAAKFKPRTAANATPYEAQEMDLARPPVGKSRTRAVATMAVMHKPESPAMRTGLTERMPQTRAVAARAEMPETPAARSMSEAEAQFVVVTAWQQVEVVQQTSRVRADFDAAAQPDGAADREVEQFTVTRLIFRVAPRTMGQAALPPVRDGWLVLQL